jgi:hypothetical protein
VTVSFSKSISVLHASIRENARRARLAGDDRAAVYWAGREERFQEVLHRANRAALEYAQRWAGMTRTGFHGIRVNGQEPGRFAEAGLIVTSWLQGTSRDGDPQDHIHNQIARITRTVSDGRWRALDTACLREVPGALQAIAATVVECELTREFGVRWVPRPDERGNEIAGITRAQMDAYSTRTAAVHEKERELARAWERRHGRAPNSRELFYLAQKATLRSRKDKSAGEIDWDALAQRWDAAIGGELAGIAPAVSALRGAGADGVTPDGREPTGALSRDALVRAAQKALCLVSEKRPTWTRHHLLKQLALVMPAETRNLAPGSAEALLTELADEALSGRIEPVLCVSAPEWPPLPTSLRRELDGGSIYTRPGTTRYATAAQLSAEERLVAQAQAQRAPHLPRKLAARHLGANAAVLEAKLQERAQDARERVTPRGLRLDQAAAVYHVLTSSRVTEVVVGPAGTDKTRVLAAAARAWTAQHGDGRVFGTATSQNAANELRKAGVQVTANTTRLLASIRRGQIPAGSLILADEGSMISLLHLSALVSYAASRRCKVVLAGDQEQLAAVEGGGAMMLLADRLGYVQLAEPVRFAAEWERDASLRLRAGDQTALDDYDQHGRIHGAPPDEAMDQAVKAYLASYLAGHDVILTAADWARCRELSRQIRGDLIHLGLVDGGRTVQIADGAQASVGDLIICRDNDHDIEAGEPGRGLANGDVLRIEGITANGIQVRRMLDPDPATGARRFTNHAFCYTGYRTSDLAYAITEHSAQGGTVHTGITLVTGSETRQWLYSALTRGTEKNMAFVFTQSPKIADPLPGTRPAPELERYERIRQEREGLPPASPEQGPAGQDPREPGAVLGDVLMRDGSEISASETRRRNLANADHLGILNAIWDAESQTEQNRHYHDLVLAALPPGYRQELSYQARWLYRTLRTAELAGLDPADVIRRAVDSRDLAGARDVASILDARIRQRAQSLLPQPQGPWAGRVPQLDDPERRAYLTEIAAMMDDRKQRLGQHAAGHPPAWALKTLGPVPADGPARQEWRQRASSIGAYREMYSYEHPVDPIGPQPAADSPDRRAAWHEAFLALGTPGGPDVRGMPDGRLWLIRDTYATETRWAPQHVGRELRLARLGAYYADRDVTRAEAEAAAARKHGNHERADRHQFWAAAYQAMGRRYREQEETFAATMDDRREWEHATEHSRHLAVAADGELRRRHPSQRIEPLRSAEPAPVSETDREELTLNAGQDIGQMARWIQDLAAQRKAFREKLEERKGLMIPSEDPSRGDLGEAFPDQAAASREAILQPPKPQIRPSAKILEAARQRDVSHEAAG